MSKALCKQLQRTVTGTSKVQRFQFCLFKVHKSKSLEMSDDSVLDYFIGCHIISSLKSSKQDMTCCEI